MIYAAMMEYITNTEKISELRPKHREYLSSLLDTGKLVTAGPFLDDFGALIVYNADSPEGAEELIRNDPFHAAGIFVKWTVRPWKMVMANPELMPKA
ncbi:YciI family protein [soil metagenome]